MGSTFNRLLYVILAVICLLLCFAPASSGSSKDLDYVVITHRSLEDWFEVRRKSEGFDDVKAKDISDMEMMVMTGNDGKKFNCYLPNWSPSERKEGNPNLTEEEKVAMALEKTTKMNVGANACYILAMGYWTYELCPGKHALQYHDADNKESGFNLGSFDSGSSALGTHPSTGRSGLVQSFSGGTDGRTSTVTYI